MFEEIDEIFAAVDEIGAKYQSGDEVAAFQAEMDEIMAEVRSDAAARGEYDKEKQLWLI